MGVASVQKWILDRSSEPVAVDQLGRVRTVDQATVDLDVIRSAGVPVLVIRGDWSSDPPWQWIAGAAFRAIAEAIAAGVDADILVAPVQLTARSKSARTSWFRTCGRSFDWGRAYALRTTRRRCLGPTRRSARIGRQVLYSQSTED